MRWVERLHFTPPFDCAWCVGTRTEDPRHDLCTGTAVRPHSEFGYRPAGVADCACALRAHRSGDRPRRPPTLPPPQRPD